MSEKELNRYFAVFSDKEKYLVHINFESECDLAAILWASALLKKEHESSTLEQIQSLKDEYGREVPVRYILKYTLSEEKKGFFMALTLLVLLAGFSWMFFKLQIQHLDFAWIHFLIRIFNKETVNFLLLCVKISFLYSIVIFSRILFFGIYVSAKDYIVKYRMITKIKKNLDRYPFHWRYAE